ncbi:clostripain-related cysteine peptidase [Mucilaginibacter pocheonensis]|uniref:Uncharacterized protein n=1 Tax=Mucilaginibacter pocheonensis TaxID=398050 RepID=A0ABU1T8F5_9SPHI|nr:clostripain-related cysteine peptidase [Mucilaginibacter pocheonensis]MDR6941688.1 hypothetical protein [Mucilaginibacter pocheonensis]
MAAHADSTPKWNIIFLIYAKLGDAASENTYDPNLLADTSKYLGELKEEIKGIPLSPNFKIWIIENIVYLENRIKVSDHTYLSQLESDHTNPSVNIFTIAKTYSEENIVKSAELLQSVFRDIETALVAEKNLLITWDHGSAFGIFKSNTFAENLQQRTLFNSPYHKILQQITDEEHSSVQSEPILTIIKNDRYPRLAKVSERTQGFTTAMHTIMPEKTEDILTNDELGIAIKKGFSAGMVDVLIMFNCYMQNMHTCHSLKDCVNLLVAPEGLISEPGYDYTLILKAIANFRDINPEKIAEIAVSSMNAKFIRAGLERKFELHAMFAVDLSGYDRVIEKMKTLVQFLRTKIARDVLFKANTKLSRRSCYEMDLPLNYNMVDLINWMTKLSSMLQLNEIDSMLNDFETTYLQLVKISAIGKNPYFIASRMSWERNHGVPPKGVTIYFPTSRILRTDPVANDFIFPNSAFQTSLLKEIKWFEFLTELYS